MKLFTLTVAFFVFLTAFGQKEKFDLVIKNATVFNSETGKLSLNQTILIKDGIITNVTGRLQTALFSALVMVPRRYFSARICMADNSVIY